MLEKKTLMRFGQEPLLNGMKRKYKREKEKVAAAVIITLEQEKADISVVVGKAPKKKKNTLHGFTSLKLDTRSSRE